MANEPDPRRMFWSLPVSKMSEFKVDDPRGGYFKVVKREEPVTDDAKYRPLVEMPDRGWWAGFVERFQARRREFARQHNIKLPW